MFNHDYFSTGTGYSLHLGARFAHKMVVAWDGDLLVHRDDIQSCLDHPGEYLGYSDAVTDDGVYIHLTQDTENVVRFSREDMTPFEWSGPAKLNRDRLTLNYRNVFDGLIEHLPLPAKFVRAFDIDTPGDYDYAVEHFGEFISSVGGTRIHWIGTSMGNSKSLDYYDEMAKTISSAQETRNKAPDFSAYDIAFVKQFQNANHALLDLGAGTGLLLNGVMDGFDKVTAVELYPSFSQFITDAPHLTIVNENIMTFDTSDRFDLVLLFGVMNCFNAEEAATIYANCAKFLHPGGRVIVKNQMGVNDDVLVDTFSEELGKTYFSSYRHPDSEKALLSDAGLITETVTDIYPDTFNRWDNTRFMALVAQKPSN